MHTFYNCFHFITFSLTYADKCDQLYSQINLVDIPEHLGQCPLQTFHSFLHNIGIVDNEEWPDYTTESGGLN